MRLTVPLLLLSTAFLASTAAPALAQATAPIDDPNAIVEELVVTARYPGPAYWRVSDADSEVWILGIPGRIPSNLVWDKTRTADILKGANGVIMPSVATAKFSEILKFTLKNLKNFSNEGDQTLEQVVPPSVAQHYRQLPPALRRDDLLKSTFRPVFAAFALEAKAIKTNGWVMVESDIVSLAKKAKVKTRRASETPVLPLATAMMSMSQADQAQCFDAFVTDVEQTIMTIDPVARAWANGQTAEMLNQRRSSGIEDCLYSISEIKRQRALVYQTEIKTIKAALDQPGKTVMIANIHPLVAQNGILARLKAEGLTVRTPAD
jgi:hypothetical protein